MHDLTADDAEPWGFQLRRWREDVMRWTQQDLVDQIVKRAFETKEDRGTRLDARLVGRWENGAVGRPQPVYRRLLAHLGAPLPAANVRGVTTTATRMPGGCPADSPAADLTSITDNDPIRKTVTTPCSGGTSSGLAQRLPWLAF